VSKKQLEEFVAKIFPNEKKTNIKKTVSQYGNCITDLVKTFLIDQQGFKEPDKKEKCSCCKEDIKGRPALGSKQNPEFTLCFACAMRLKDALDVCDTDEDDLNNRKIQKFISVDSLPHIGIDLVDRGYISPPITYILLNSLRAHLYEEIETILKDSGLEGKADQAIGTEDHEELKEKAKSFKIHEVDNKKFIDAKDLFGFLELTIKKNLAKPESILRVLSGLKQK
jgi:hypothetical protein